MTWPRLLMLMSLVALTGCSVTAALDRASNRAGEATGKAIGTKVAKAAPAPKAKTVVDPKGGSFCGSMTRLGWPIKPTDADRDHLKQMSRAVVEPIIGAQTHGKAECPGWTAQ